MNKILLILLLCAMPCGAVVKDVTAKLIWNRATEANACNKNLNKWTTNFLLIEISTYNYRINLTSSTWTNYIDGRFGMSNPLWQKLLDKIAISTGSAVVGRLLPGSYIKIHDCTNDGDAGQCEPCVEEILWGK